jgi:hypothetical protein
MTWDNADPAPVTTAIRSTEPPEKTVTVTELEQAQLVGIHALYPDAAYEIGVVGQHFVGIEEVWQASLALAYLRATGKDPGPLGLLCQQERQAVFFHPDDLIPKALLPPETLTEFLRAHVRRPLLGEHKKDAQSLFLRLRIYRLRAGSQNPVVHPFGVRLKVYQKSLLQVRSVLPLMISYSLLHVAGDRGCSGLRGLERAPMTLAGAASSIGGSPAASRCRCS